MGINFKAFAFRIAHFKTLEALRAQKRGHWLQFDSELLDTIALQQSEDESSVAGKQHALRQCLAELSEPERSLIHARNIERQTVRDISKGSDRSEAALQQAFSRIRNAHRSCINNKLLGKGASA